MQNIKLAAIVFISALTILWGANAAFAQSPAERLCTQVSELYESVAMARDADIDYKKVASALLESGVPVDVVAQIIRNVYVDAAGYSLEAIRAVAYEGCMEAAGEAV